MIIRQCMDARTITHNNSFCFAFFGLSSHCVITCSSTFLFIIAFSLDSSDWWGMLFCYVSYVSHSPIGDCICDTNDPSLLYGLILLKQSLNAGRCTFRCCMAC
eukprot:236667_1